MDGYEVLERIKVWRDGIAGRASHMEARGDRYGDHDAWEEAKRLTRQVRDLDALIGSIAEAMGTEEPDVTARRHAREDSGIAMGLRWAHRLIGDAIGQEADARRRDGMYHASEIVLQASKAMEL